VHLQTRLGAVARSLRLLYGAFPVEGDDSIAEIHARLARPWGLRRWLRPHVFFHVDGQNLFEPFPLALAPPLFEWGLNWCISTRAHRFLILHSAVVERDGRAVILPAHPGSGKSTLCAGLVHRGYRLLSDEHVLLRPEDGHVVPVPRPVALKNESIAVLRDCAPELVWGPSYDDARKGIVTHVQPPAESVARASETALPGAIVFPHFEKGSATRLVPVPKAEALMELVDNSVNYSLWGARGFDTLADLVDRAPCYAFDYDDLDEAMAALEGVEAAS
jgi:HprK-related kinase A